MNLPLLCRVLAGISASVLHAQPSSPVDSTYRPVFNRQPDAVLPLSDGRVYVAGANLSFPIGTRIQKGIARLNRDGSVDPTFNAGNGLEIDILVKNLIDTYRSDLSVSFPLQSGSPTSVSLIAQRDGKIAAFVGWSYQDFRTFGFFNLLIARFNPDGSKDSQFQPDLSLRMPALLPVSLADGRWLKVQPTKDRDNNRTIALTRYTDTGAVDPTFGQKVLEPVKPASVPAIDQLAATFVSEMDEQGRIYLGTYHSYQIFNLTSPATSLKAGDTNPKTSLFRLLPDGTPDPSFAPQKLDEILTLRSTRPGLVCQQNQWAYETDLLLYPPGFGIVNGGALSVLRVGFDGKLDPAFQVSKLSAFKADYRQLAVGADGSIYCLVRGQNGHRGIVRLDPNGVYDPDFSCELEDATTQITEIFPLPDGQLLAFGSFTSIAGVQQPYLARLTPNTRAGATRLSNVSIRARAGFGSETLIAGVISAGGDTTILARAAGPALAQFGLPNPLADPRLAFYDGPTLVMANDDWDSRTTGPTLSAITRLNAFPFAADSKDAALFALVPSGVHTFHVTSGDSTSGIALLELYSADPPLTTARSPRITNFSARAVTGPGADFVAGFTLSGPGSRNVLIRAVGSTLSKFGLTGGLADPVLTVYQGSSVVARNDNLADGTFDASFLRTQAAASVGAFPLDVGGKDSTLVLTLAPGIYTLQITGKLGAAGLALVEIYEIP